MRVCADCDLGGFSLCNSLWTHCEEVRTEWDHNGKLCLESTGVLQARDVSRDEENRIQEGFRAQN